MKITAQWLKDDTFVTKYDNDDYLIIDEKAATLIKPDNTTQAWWQEEPTNCPQYDLYLTNLESKEIEPKPMTRISLLHTWDIGHRFDNDQRRTEALNKFRNELT
jgi:hypothetical protein